MMKKFIYLFLLISCYIACQTTDEQLIEPTDTTEEETTIVPPILPTTATPISFSCAMVGQRSLYQAWSVVTFPTTEQIRAEDTLAVEIVAEENGVFTLEEYFIDDTIHTDFINNLYPDSVYTYQMQVVNDSIYFFHTNNEFPFSRLNTAYAQLPKIVQANCTFTQGTVVIQTNTCTNIPQEGWIDSLVISDQLYENTSVKVRDETAFDGNRQVLAYTLEYGFISSSISNWGASIHGGWDLMMW